MAAADHVIGFDGKTYYNASTNASPSWTEITAVGDASLDLSFSEPDVSTRESIFELIGLGRGQATINLSYLHQTGTDAVFNDLLNACRLGSTPAPKQLALMDGNIATSGSKGLRAYCAMTGMPQSQEMDNGMRYEMSFRPARFVEASAVIIPDWFVVP